MKNFLQVNRALVAEKNFRLVNRALAAEKNFYLISKLFHDEVMSRSSRGQVEGNSCVEHFSHKALMLLFAVLVMSMANIGTAWGASPLTVETPDAPYYTQDGVTVFGENTTGKMKNSSSQKCYNTNNASVIVFSELTNITGISFDMCLAGDGSGEGNAISLYTSTGGVFAVPSSGFTATKGGSALGSLTNIQAIKANQSSLTSISVTFDSPVKGIELKKAASTNIRNIVVTYNNTTLPSVYFKATTTSTADVANVETTPSGGSMTVDTKTNKKTINSIDYYQAESGSQTINLGTGNTFQAGDQIVLEFCGSGNNKTVGPIIQKTTNCTISVTVNDKVPAKVAYIVSAGDGIQGQTSATIIRTSSDLYIRSFSVLRSAAACTAPNHVDLSSSTDEFGFFGGETINLTAQAYLSEGTGSPIAEANITGYQWKHNGVNIAGATSKTYIKENCTVEDAGDYSCVVSTGATCSTESALYGTKVYVLQNYTGGTTTYNFTRTGSSKAGTVAVTLANNTQYQFKIYAGSTASTDYYMGNNGTIEQDISNWDFEGGKNNVKLNSGLGGTFTFAIDYTANGGAPKISVTYPRKTIYMKCGSTWCDASPVFFAHTYGVSNYDVKLTQNVCDATVYQANIPAYNSKVVFTRQAPGSESIAWSGNANYWNESQEITLSTYDLFTCTGWSDSKGTFSRGTYSPTTHEISFAGNGNTSGSMSAIGSIACDADQAITANSFEKTGYTFANWTANVDVKVGGATVTAGSAIANSATIQNITSDITLTAQWTPVQYDVTLEKGSAPAAGSSGSAKVYYDAAALTNISHATWAGHVLTGYYTSNSGGTKVLNADGTFAATNVSDYITDGKWSRAENTTVKAQWTAKTTSLTLNPNTANHGTGSNVAVTATYGSALPSFAAATPASGYELTGYFTDATSGTKIINADGTLVASTTYADGDSHWNSELASLTLYAQYEEEVSGCIDANSTNFGAGNSSGDASTTLADGTTVNMNKCTNSASSVSIGGNILFTAPTGKAFETFSFVATCGSADRTNYYKINGGSQQSLESSTTTAKRYTITIPASPNTTTIQIIKNGTTPAVTEFCYTYKDVCATPTTAFANGAYTVGGSALDLSTLISGKQGSGAITYTIKKANGTGAAIDGSNFTATSAGTATVTATQAANGDYCEKVMDATITVSAAAGHTVTYNYNGATGGAGTPSATGTSVTLPNPTKTGCTLQGWYTSSGALAGAATATYNPTADITLYALWRENCDGAGTKTLVDINFKDDSWTDKTFSQANDNNEDLINGVYFWSKDASKHFSLADNTSKGLTFPDNNMSSGTYYFCIPITGINSSSKQITVTLKHGYSSNKASYKYVYVDGRTTFVDANTGGSGGTQVEDAANADTEITFTKSSLSNTSGHLIIGRKSSSYTQIYGVTVTTPNNATCYYVTYNGNGATGGFMADETAHGSGDDVAILANTYTRTGYTFTGWKTEPSSGTSYEPEGTITGISSNITLYAQWSAGTLYSVTYNGNGATSGSVPVDASSPYASGSNVTVLGNTGSLALANYTFDGWATANDGTGTSYAADGTISGISADVVLFAKWKQTVTLNTGSQGSEEEKTPYIYINGAALNGFSAHTAAGYTLNGYYTAPTGGTKVLNADGSFAAAAVTNYITGGKWSRTDATTLYAQWRAAAGSTCYEWDATETKPQTGTNVNFGGLYLTAPNKTKVSFYSGQEADSCYDISAKAKTLYGHLNGLEIASVKFAVSSNSSDYRTIFIAFCSSTTFSTSNIIEVGGYQGTVYTVNKNDAAKSEFTVSAPAGTKSFAIGRNMDGITYSESFTAGQNRYLYYLQVCSAGGGTHTITYANGGGTGTMTSDADIADDGTKTLKTNTFTAPTNYSFAGWVADGAVTIGGDVKTAGTLIADGATITNITMDIALTAKWTQSITLNANTANHGTGDNTEATVMYNATALSSITHTSAEIGYKLAGYYTAATEGTKVLNSDGTFAGTDIDGWISDGKWTCTGGTRVLYAQYEPAGALIWNLGVNTDATSLTTSSKSSSFSQIAMSNMSSATLAGSLTYEQAKKSSLTGKISTPASYTAADYVYVTFQVASGYKFTPSSVKVKVQPVSTAKSVKLVLADLAEHSIDYTTPSTISGGSTQTVEMTNGSGTFFTGTVTLKIYCYGATDKYCLGTPIQIDGEVEAVCTMPDYERMSYSQTEYIKDAAASAITVIGGTDVTTYQWKYNETGDRSSGTNCGTNDPSFTPSTASPGTLYYWCELTNGCGTVKTPAVGITVSVSKSDATISWTGTSASANYGGGGYTVTATVSTAEWDGTLTEDMLTAMDGVVLSNINVTNDGKTISANFGVTEGANAEATNVAFYLNHPATTGYNAIDETYNTTTLVTSCIGAGGGDGTSYDVRVRKSTTTILQGKSTVVYGWDTPTKGFVTQNTGGSVTSGKSGYDDVPVFDSISKGNAKAYWVKSYVANVKKIRVYGQVADDDLTATGVYHVGSFVAGGSSTAVAYTVVYEDEVDALKKGNHWFEITLDEAISTNDIIYFTVNKNFKIMGVRLTTVGAGGATLETALSAWSPAIDTRKEVNEDAASFVETVTKTGANANTMGAITYSSGDETIATVDNRTGRVTIANSITWGDDTYKDITITASLAPSGCYQGKTATYTLRVKKLTCTEAAGTITASSEGSHVVIDGDEVKKCTSETITLTLGGYEEGATSFQWYKDGVLQDDKTTASITTGEAGVWYAVSNKGCAVTSTNEITIINRSTSVHVARLVTEWYIKNGRLTPPIALWKLGDGATFSSVAASGSWATNTGFDASDFYAEDGIVYLTGEEPSANNGEDVAYTLTLTVSDACGGSHELTGQTITVTHQKNTDKHVLAFVVTGTEKGGFTDGITADQTTNLDLYNTIATNFDVLTTNIYSTDDEQKLKEYYSQFDILCVTDYPNTQTKGVNKKSYVNSLGALIDIRPILTMEAFVSKLNNWKAKGVSGDPKSPTTRQYTMLLQCKDHEIFEGTRLTKIGEGDEAMYKVCMVDSTKEDYATLDATYGSGTHAEKEGYQYGKKPALQGFTYTSEMSNNDLLPLGLIGDGAGNDLQVGIERQENMEARLMVLGINSYAMERLTDDGERVVINALNYLMKKNQEDIADCSTAFVGGAEGDTKNWNNADNWTGNTVPLATQKVRILADCEVSSTVRAQSVLIVTDGQYNHGSDNAAGKLTIKGNGALIVGGKVQAASAPAYNRPRATSAGDLAVLANPDGNGTLIFDNGEGETKATIQMYSKAIADVANNYAGLTWQYVAVPYSDNNNAHHNYYDSWLYAWAADNSGWEVVPNRGNVYPWIGYCITQDAPKTYTMDGTLVETTEQEFTVPANVEKVIGNSWTAPLQVKQFTDDDFGALTKNIYLFNTGLDSTCTGGNANAENRYLAGTYVTIPIHSSPYTGDSLVSSLQAFFVKNASGSEATLTLDYDRHVRPTRSTDKVNAGPMHAPSRFIASDEPTVLKIWASGSRYDDRLILLEREDFSTGYDAGWDGDKWKEGDASPRIYTIMESGEEAITATPELEGTIIGFRAGEDNTYTLRFEYNESNDPLYILDTENRIYTRVLTDQTYQFTTNDKAAHSRFVLTRTDGQMTPTGIDDVQGDKVHEAKAKKFIMDDKMYILFNGRVFDATGKAVK